MTHQKEKIIYNKIYIQAPYHEKNLAKKLGAMWDAKCKSWYIYNHIDVSTFNMWHYDFDSDAIYFSKLNQFYFTKHGNIYFYFSYNKTSWLLNWKATEKIIDCNVTHWCKYNNCSLDELTKIDNCTNCPNTYIEAIITSCGANNEHELIKTPSSLEDVRKNILHSYAPISHNYLNQNRFLFKIMHSKWIYRE